MKIEMVGINVFVLACACVYQHGREKVTELGSRWGYNAGHGGTNIETVVIYVCVRLYVPAYTNMGGKGDGLGKAVRDWH